MRALTKVLAATALLLSLAGTAAADHTKVFRDPPGDSGTAPDYTHLRVISGLDGTLLLGTQVANRTTFQLHDFYRFALDTDRDGTTPGVNAVRGSEIVIVIRHFLGGHTMFIEVWDDTIDDYREVEPPADFGYGAGPFAEIRMRDFGLGFGDRFDISIDSLNSDTDATDVAPGGAGRWTFQIRRCDFEGTRGDDRLSGRGGSDWMCGFGGDDRLRGRGGDDLIYGGRGNDRLIGGAGLDVIEGGKGRDDIRAGGGGDFVYVRGGGADTVRCGPGEDEVEADSRDELIGCELRFP